MICLRSPIRPAVWLKGGFIRTTVGWISRGRTLWSWEASSVKTLRDPINDRRRSARRGASSLAKFAAPSFPWIDMEPVPAEGSRITSWGEMLATQAAT